MSGNPAITERPSPLLKKGVRDILALVKCHLSLYIGLSAVTGHVIAGDRLTMESLEIGIWVTLLAMGAGVLNNIQDRFFDQGFRRTQNRILASQRLEPGLAGMIATVLILSGLLGLKTFSPGPLPFVLGIAALIFYNGLYTPMKKKGGRPGCWAMVPGTLSGMIPPALGWTGVAKGVSVIDPSGLFIFMAGMGLWQFPHYLLLDIKQAKEKKNSPWPGFTRVWSEKEALFQVMIWSGLFSMSMALFLTTGWIGTPGPALSLFFLSLGLPVFLAFLFYTKPQNRYLDLGFWCLNLTMLSYMVLILLDRV